MLQGAARHAQRLAGMAKNIDQLERVLFAAGDEIRVTARKSITAGAVSGKGHVPSEPGQPPKADTHHLDSNITTERTGFLKVEVRSQSEYAAALEYGTSKMAERPYMRPAVAKVKPKIRGMVTAEVTRIVRSS